MLIEAPTERTNGVVRSLRSCKETNPAPRSSRLLPDADAPAARWLTRVPFPRARYTVINSVEPNDDFVYGSAVWDQEEFWPSAVERPRSECSMLCEEACGMQTSNPELQSHAFAPALDLNWIAREYSQLYISRVR